MLKTFALIALCSLASLSSQAGELYLGLTCNIVKPQEALKDVTVVARLYAYDPMLADVSATEVDKVVLSGLDISKDKQLVLKFPLSADREERRSYYVTVFVHPNAEMKDRLYFIKGLQKVFENGDNEVVSVDLTPVSK